LTWFKVDDKFHDHRKVRLLGKDKLAAVGVWTMCGSWSADTESDGFVPAEVVQRFDTKERYAKRLVDVELWRPSERDGERGYQFHEWEQDQPTRAQLQKRREDTKRRVEQWRNKRSGDTSSEQAGNYVGNALQDDGVTPPPTRPDPTITNTSCSSDASDPPRPDVEQLCHRLLERVIDNGAKPTTAVTKKWRTEARLLLDRDGRELGQALRLIDWATSNTFWSPNILSMPKFREKYDQLLMQARREHQQKQEQANGHQSQTDANIARLLSGPPLRALGGAQ
jgi:hypothetical protein